MIKLHPQLEKDCFYLGEFSLCALLLLNDTNFPWFILVPNTDNITELHHLDIQDQQQLLVESTYLSECLESLFQPDKLNIAALGNMVPQLHIHHIARYKTDACWPAPVWGSVAAKPYPDSQYKEIKDKLTLWFDQNTRVSFHSA